MLNSPNFIRPVRDQAQALSSAIKKTDDVELPNIQSKEGSGQPALKCEFVVRIDVFSS